MTSDNKLLQAITLQNQGSVAEAARLFQDILAQDPDNAAALYSLAVIQLNAGKHEAALALTAHGTQAAPGFSPLFFAHASILQALGRNDEALQAYDAALAIQPDYPDVLINSGALLRSLFRHHEALERFNRALTIDPNHAPALANCAILLTEFKQGDKAIAMFRRLLAIQPDYDYGLGLLIFERLHSADWTDFDRQRATILAGIREGKRVCKTLAFMALSDSASEHFCCARIFGHHFAPAAGVPLWQGERYQHKRLKIAYVSPDLREHPVGHLMAGVFENHDKSRFETIAISLGIDDGSRLRGRMLEAFEHFIDAKRMDPLQIARLMRDMEVDIAVDLAGYTSDSRIGIYAHRPAPVHVNFLGYAGTLGLDYMDYILADEQTIPPRHQPFYSERVEYLPEVFMPTDSSLRIAERIPSREESGLPPDAKVFCSFSPEHKISPPLWKVWMRILERTPGSVLWLSIRGETSRQNFRDAAKAQGIDPERLVFAGRVPLVEDHLARYRIADVFLDTWPYNAHTTASDVLMAGLPLITYMGDSFPSRVAGSLLHAVGLDELITHSLEEYEALAVALIQDDGRLAALKAKLADSPACLALFDTARYTRNLEQAFERMHAETMRLKGRDAAVAAPAVSVIVPCYKQAEYLPEVVASVVAQTFPDWEMLIVNDGSPDDTSAVARQLIAAYPERSIRLLEKPNGGLADARNFGIRVAKGKYILPLDCDDILHPRMLETTVTLLDANPDVAIAYTDVQEFGASSKRVQAAEFQADKLCLVNHFAYCSLYRREVWETVGGYNTNMTYGYEDWNYWVSCAEHGFVARRCPEALLLYRVKDTSMYTTALKHDAELRAQIVLNHPRFYDQSMILRARAILDAAKAGQGADAEAEQTEITALVSAAERMAGEGNLALASVHYRQWLWFHAATSPLAYAIQFNLGVLLTQMGDVPGAVQAYQQALEKRPDFAPARANLGLLLKA